MSIFSKQGHVSVLSRSHATNRIQGKNEIVQNTETIVRNVRERPLIHAQGHWEPKGAIIGPLSPSIDQDEVWATDLAPIALGSDIDVFPGPADVSLLPKILKGWYFAA